LLRKTDDYVIGRFTTFCHWWQRLTGLTNFWWARGALVGTIAMFMLSMLSMVMFPIALVPFFYILIPARAGWKALGMVEDHYLSGSATAHMLTLHWCSMYWARLAVILYLPILVVCCWLAPEQWRMGFRYMGTTFGLLFVQMYLMCVIPLPPAKSKVREFLESLRPAPKPVQVPAS